MTTIQSSTGTQHVWELYAELQNDILNCKAAIGGGTFKRFDEEVKLLATSGDGECRELCTFLKDHIIPSIVMELSGCN